MLGCGVTRALQPPRVVKSRAPETHERNLGMKGFAIVASLSFIMSAAPVFAQAAGQTQPKPAQPPAAQQPKPTLPPATTPPATTPAPTVPPPAAQPPAPFPAGAKIAFINPQRIFQES